MDIRSAQKGGNAMKNERISTGIKGLNEILGGGFMPSSSYLIVGGPGTGKTVLSLQFLSESAKRKARCLLITFAEPEETIRRNAAVFGWDLSGITIVDFSKTAPEDLASGEYTVFSPSEVETEPVWKRIYQALEAHAPERLVIDSATYLRYLSTDEYQYRKQIQGLANQLSAKKCLSLLLFEPIELEKDNALALAVDGVLTLRNDISENQLAEIRTVEINKMRGSSFMSGRHPLRITRQGVTVWPHRIATLKKYAYERKHLASGIAGLDQMLAGGVHTGTCTLISGPAGAGKTTLALQFLITAAANGHKGVIYTFEEGLASMLERCNALSIPLEKRLEDGSLLVREINPLERYPDEFLEMLRQDMEKNSADVFILDSLRGYNLAMEAFGSVITNMQNIINYVRRNRASLFIVNEQEKITGDLQITDLGVSYVADNVILIRYAEVYGQVIKVINCLKKRLGNHQPELRELKITEQGLEVGDKLVNLRGLLTGVPTHDTAKDQTAPAGEKAHEK
ncbi:MAG: recombinase RecA [Desulfobacterales bacterium CG23_combo_of_CG06-09_8_20_14_all_51_8]|nr:MAG: recombinase RecA [Desulfobacterales bacterium CG23_combo_of_CG06-09_8_20_14_all_51_8]